MAGIYIHIPFCKSRCVYCGFFSTVSLDRREEYVDCVCRELRLRREYLGGEDITTIYFGGGTPSQLSPGQIETILTSIHNIYNVRETAEITVECNPDDITLHFLSAIRNLGVNRLSMGIQTFDDSRLQFLHRRHTAAQAVTAVKTAKAAGFANISVDLMFGFPGQTLNQWKQDVDTALSMGVQHLSAYSLMYEEGTALTRMLERGDFQETDEETSLSMYEYLLDATACAGFEHYEISNFALPGFRSRHNSSYWQGIPYLGIGAGAHSYNGYSRQYNPDNLQLYIDAIRCGTDATETENLTEAERYNEFVFTSLRTCEGIHLPTLLSRFGEERQDYLLRCAQPHLQQQRIIQNGEYLRLSRSGIFVSNSIMSDLMEA